MAPGILNPEDDRNCVDVVFLGERKHVLYKSDKTLFIDARKLGAMVSRKLRELTEDDIRKI